MTGTPDNPSERIEALVPLVYEDLRAIAHAYFRRQPPSFTLRPTEIVNEACLHLLRHGPAECDSPQHFRAIATRKIWQVIIDHLKRRHARKRGGAGIPGSTPAVAAQRVPLDTVSVEWGDRLASLLDLAETLEALEQESKRLHDVVLLHWFGGLAHPDVARVLGVSESTAEKDWRYAIAWLNRRLAGGPADEH